MDPHEGADCNERNEEFFRRGFVLKIVIFGIGGSFIPNSLLVLGGLGALSRRFRVLGTALLTVYAAGRIATSFPHTINHVFLETVFLVHLLLDPGGRRTLGEGREPSAPAMIRLTILSVWFYAGIQKLSHGYYIDGEMFVLQLLYPSGHLSESLRTVVGENAIATWSGMSPTDFSCTSISLADWVAWSLLLMSRVVVAVEVLLPPLLLFKPTRPAAAWLLVAISIGAAIATGEISFGFTSTCALLLWLPSSSGSRRAFLIYFGALGLVAVQRIGRWGLI